MSNLESLRGQHKGERAFIVGNGPSLNNTPLEALTDEVTFATNRINKIYDDVDWRPTYYSYTQSPPASEEAYRCVMETVDAGITSFISSAYKDRIPQRENVYFLNCENHLDDHYKCFENPEVPPEREHLWSDDVTEKIYSYNSSLFSLFQLAHYMGFEKLYLIGCDMGIDTDWWPIYEDGDDPIFFHQQHRGEYDSTLRKFIDFVVQSDTPLKSTVNAFALKFDRIPHAIYSDETRFTNRYLSKPYIQRGVDDCILRSQKLARKKLLERDIKVYNATLGGELEIHPRVDLEEVLCSKQV